jgi:adenylate kinase family enzyme
MHSQIDSAKLTANTFKRTIVIGNTASGKSWLAKHLGEALSLDVTELDQIRWIGEGFDKKETASNAIAKTRQKASGDQWVIEGIYGWLVSPVLDRATCLIWTDIPWSESQRNLRSRELDRGDAGNFAELEAWSRAYWERNSSSSYKAHLAIFESFKGPTIRLCNTGEASEFIRDINP